MIESFLLGHYLVMSRPVLFDLVLARLRARAAESEGEKRVEIAKGLEDAVAILRERKLSDRSQQALEVVLREVERRRPAREIVTARVAKDPRRDPDE